MNPNDSVVAAMKRTVPDKVPRLMAFTPPVMEEFRCRTGATDPAEYFDFDVRHVGMA